MPHPKFGEIGWLLGGGGCAEGAPQAAQMKVFYEHGIKPDFIIAESVGAWNSIAGENALFLWQNYVKSPDAIYRINPELKKIFEEKIKLLPHSPFHHHETWKDLASDFFNQGKHLTQFVKQILAFGSRAVKSFPYIQAGDEPHPKHFSPMVKPIFSYLEESGLNKVAGILDAAPLITLIKEKVDLKKSLENDVVLKIFARSLEKGEEHIFTPINEIELLQAAQASSALRPFFPLVKIGGTYYCDGGHMNPFPVKYALDHGCDTVFAFVKNHNDYSQSLNILESLLEETNVAQRALFIKLEKEAREQAGRENKNIFVITPQTLHPDMQILWITPEALEYTIKIETEATEKFLENILK